MKKLTQEELNNILVLHKKWFNNEAGGQRVDLNGAYLNGAYLNGAYLSGAYLCGTDLSGANLKYAELRKANLSVANLSGANLTGADLSWTNLYKANLTGADLSGACLVGADLTKADLSGADLSGADLADAILGGANLTNAKLPDFQIPQDVDLEVWKKIEKGTLVKLKIPKEAKRTSCLINNKCRAEYAEVLEIIGEGKCSKRDRVFVYEAGKVVKPDGYNDDIRADCRPGIHFFMTKEEAEGYI